MRKNILKALGLVTILAFTNCSTDSLSNQDPIVEKSADASTLKSNLLSFNKNFVYKKNNNLAGKKWWQYVGQASAIASGDAGGALGMAAGVQWLAGVVGAATAGTGYAVVSGVAGVIGAVGGSYAAYCSTGGHCKGTFNGTNAMGSSVIYDFPAEYDYIENFGILHNNALQNIYMSENNVDEITWISNNIPNVNEIDYQKLYDSDEFKTLTSEIVEITEKYKISGYDINVLLSGYKDKNLITDNNFDIMTLYFKATSQVETFEDYKAITDYYVEQVNSSTLTQTEKEALYSAFAVSIQSYYYWLNLEIN